MDGVAAAMLHVMIGTGYLRAERSLALVIYMFVDFSLLVVGLLLTMCLLPR